MTSYALRNASPAKSRADAVVIGVVPGKGRRGTPQLAEGAQDVASAYGRRLAPMLSSLGVRGKAGEVAKVPTHGTIKSPLLVFVGLGEEPGPREVRAAAGNAARAVTNAASVALALPADGVELVRAAMEGYLLGGYTFTDYRSNGAERESAAEIVLLTPLARRKEATAALEAALAVTTATTTTRDWVNVPGADLTPPVFAESVTRAVRAATKASGSKVRVTVRDEKELAKLGCGGILGVGQGSAAPPRLLEMEYRPKGATTHLALVGKGITYDSGGLTLKPGSGMATMKSDMAGAAAVVMATLAIAELGLPVRVTTYAAMAENMVSGASMRPGDVLRTYSGKTVEITNTDAEGRLVLADALTMATEKEPDLIVDVATLTGHMVQALGDRIAGVLGDDPSVAQVLAAAETAGEDAWPMPIHEYIESRVHGSKIADLAQHDWVRWGGGLMAAAFLREFTAGRPWAHLDIAGPGYNSGGAVGHWTPGGTGYGVATLVELARSLAESD
ncbi:leucyl aminopeptidase [Nocardioides panacisoli]|uniref:leucyl aminopeptidase n=1 Tax=Nocardioides panacisoli TaxID=627624 RepID=UPI001C62C9AC|nr:leucyl aminopeptidase [Nocardioides panacisoli]QYJ05325.1 leucyl aminopeptidase [Nocardioides panacisoli]